MPRDLQEWLQKSDVDLARLESSIAAQGFDWQNVDHLSKQAHPSSLTVTDLLTALLVGTVGGLISSSDDIRKYCDSVHQDSSKGSPTTLLGKLFAHKGDNIDQFPIGDGLKKFITREGQTCSPRFHRVMFGHDPFSIGGDNPFAILAKQHGLAKGTAQACRHLVADTFSKQGLPLPFHSYFDYSTESGLSNYFTKWCTEISNGTNLNPPEAFGQIFGIRAQDIGATLATVLFAKAYFRFFGVTNELRMSQFRLVAYSTTFVTGSVRFYAKTGIPGINWPCIPLLLKELWTFFRLNYRELWELEQHTASLIESNRLLEELVFAQGNELPTLAGGADYCNEIYRGEANFGRLF